jgi:LuxR family transcriptional regulator, activator of conjugal transfer of Ti plasmids
VDIAQATNNISHRSAPLHRVFQQFVDRLIETRDSAGLRSVLSETASALGVASFAYLALPQKAGESPQHVTNYPIAWAHRYFGNHYEKVDPVLRRTRQSSDPFRWGPQSTELLSNSASQQLFDEAKTFGIEYGLTIPIHDRYGFIAALTFAASERDNKLFSEAVSHQGHVLQLLAIYFHAHARRLFMIDRTINGVILSRRELECLRWASLGKSAWEIACILGISRRTACFHLDNAKAKLGVRSICQAVAMLSAAEATI